MADCTCGWLKVGTYVTDTRTWASSCPEHGLKSAWYKSPEQVQKRKEQEEWLRDLQRRAAEARSKVKAEVAECND